MTKELSEIIERLKTAAVYGTGISLDKKAVRLVIKYINELEIEISGGYEED